MKEGWEYIDFKDVYPIKMGKTPPRGDKSSWDEKKETNNKWVSIADISNNEGKIIEDTKEYISDTAATKLNKVAKGSLLMSFKLSIGRMAFAGDDLFTNEAIIAIPESNKYNLHFIYYYLLSYDWLSLTEGNEKVKGATLNKTSIGKIQLPVLSSSVQQSIVDYLAPAFAKIDTMKANAEKALNEAKALFQASLKDMLEPKEGWEEKTLKDIVSFFSGYAFESKRYTNCNDDVLLVCGDNIVHCGFRWETIKHWPKEEYEGLKRFSLEENDIVLAMDRPWVKSGLKIAQISSKELPSLLIQRTACIRVPKDVSSNFIFYTLQTDDFIKYLVSLQTGVGVPHISGKQILSYKISIPKFIEQQSIVATLDSLKSKIDSLQENCDKISKECDALKQAILRQVFE